ncbi:hypothetical protein H6G91_37975 [Nostoc muscorum FACHB-395]|nr:hypothetical protein [Desmonostoc muscorum FACHB-395]
MVQPENLYFDSYKELVSYCYRLIKIDETSILSRVDSDFESYFEKNDLRKSIQHCFRDVSIFYQDIDIFDISLKRRWLSNFRHQYTNYDEVLNYLTTQKVKSLTSLRYIQMYDIDDLDELSKFDSIPVRQAIYIDIKSAVSGSINTTCTLRIYEKYKILENERLRKQEIARQGYIEKEKLLEESIKIQEDITNIENMLHEKFNSFCLNTTYPIEFKRDASKSLNNAIIWGIFLPTSWLSLMFLFAVTISNPSSSATSQDIPRMFGTFIFSIILGLPYLIPLTKCLIFYFQYLEQKPIYLKNLQKYRNFCYYLISQYDEKNDRFYRNTGKRPQHKYYLYTLKEIDIKIEELQK